MTHNQIELRRVKELERHNRSSEGLEQGKNDETARHNRSSEGLTRQANDNQRRYWESTSAVNWFSARSNDAVNRARINDYDSQIKRRNQQNVDDSARTMSQILANNQQAKYNSQLAKYYKAKTDEIPKESRRKEALTLNELQLGYKKGLNQTKDFFLDIGMAGAKVVGANAKPTDNALSRLFKN